MKTLLTIFIGLGAIITALGLAAAIKLLRFAYEVLQHVKSQHDDDLNWLGRKIKRLMSHKL